MVTTAEQALKSAQTGKAPKLLAGSCLCKKAPDFKLQAWNIDKFETVSLSSYKGKYVIIIFYPFDFTFVCPTEIIGFSKRKEEFDKLNAQILFVSCDSVYAHKAWAQVEESQGGIKGTIYPILSDVERLMSAHYKMLGDSGVCYRGTVILNKDSIVKSVFYYDDKVGRSVDEVIRVVQNIKQLDENNNIPFCPLDYTVKKK